ncbi:MAG TPA: serine/threonine-protein kinase [Polyangiaceae bacterium]
MGNPTPDHESAHEHELVTDDELLEEGASSSVAAEGFGPPLELSFDDLAPRRLPVRVAEVLAGKYRVERVHAPGAWGVTCDAEHLQLRQRVVVKLCFAAGRSSAAARFLESARLAAQLRSPHLARVLDLGTLDSGAAYSVTEHLSGTDLRGVLRVREWLPVAEAVDYVLQVCEGLAVAHVAGLVHRNLKPANVFLARESDGRPIIKVLDFSLVESSLADSSITTSTSDSVVSSLAYLAPEQVRDPSSVDVRADIWAVGALLHELLTGSPLYVASSVPGMFAAIAADSPTPIGELRGEIPTELEEIVLRCLEKERDYRWSDVGTLAKQLRRFASEEGRAAVDRVIMVLERRARTPRSLLPPALTKVEAPPPVARPVSSAPAIVERSPTRRLLEVGLAAMAIIGYSAGIGAFIAIHNLQSMLSARAAVVRPVVASLSPALTAAPVAAPALPQPATAAQPSAVPASVAPIAPKVSTKPAARTPPVETARPLATSAAERPVTTERAASTQALFDGNN